ncbi:unnamed protein product [Tuber melanosporum]|uniref:(Perigord truffle) hypothetical protein n=1 Tax=Tuber melanosporum (strain Mel28) TaxID=656061 RepID=D5GKY7_TUBMM|nr:uncharacterized protein GSTUM_00009838001 [Tuber melanosporum]CAZ85180.1 unnamed protein product [Tuber melanosporum]
MATGFAPPPQTFAQDDVQLSYNGYQDDLMDYEDASAGLLVAQQQAQAQNDADEAMEVDEPISTIDNLTPEKVHLRGVDNMKTSEVKAFASEHFQPAPTRVQWIDDTSCNLIYESPDIALASLSSLAAELAELPILQLRLAKAASSHPDSRLHVRIAKVDDKKEPGARDRSRFYLFHPEEDRVEQMERKKREGTRRREDREYDRRYFDSREHDRRRNHDVEQFSTDFYDDDTATRESCNNARQSRSYDRSRSISPRRNKNIELFPERKREPMEVGPRVRWTKELFPERVGSLLSRDRGRDLLGAEHEGSGSRELFPNKLGNQRFKSDRSLSPQKGISLSPPSPPGKGGSADGELELFPKKLEDRISMPGRSLEDRINLDGTSNGEEGLKIRGRGVKRDNLFAEKLRTSKGEELVFEDIGGGKRSKGRRRDKAEDMFN